MPTEKDEVANADKAESEFDGVKYTLQKPSGYQLLKAMGREGADPAEIMRGLILICVAEPKLTVTEVEAMSPKIFFGLATSAAQLVEKDLTQFQDYEKLKKKLSRGR